MAFQPLASKHSSVPVFMSALGTDADSKSETGRGDALESSGRC